MFPMQPNNRISEGFILMVYHRCDRGVMRKTQIILNFASIN